MSDPASLAHLARHARGPLLPMPQMDDARPSFVEVARWEDGTKIWRVMNGVALNVLLETLEQKPQRIHWEDLGYASDRASAFCVTVEIEGHDLPFALLDVLTLQTFQGVPNLETMKITKSTSAYRVDDVLRTVPGLVPRALGYQIAWFLLDVLGVDMRLHAHAPEGEWLRLGVPFPVSDGLLDLTAYRNGHRYLNNLEEYRTTWRFALAGNTGKLARDQWEETLISAQDILYEFMGRNRTEDHGVELMHVGLMDGKRGELRATIGMCTYEEFSITFQLSHIWPGVWSIDWIDPQKDKVHLASSDVSFMDALQKAGVFWPKSTYDAWLDAHLVPGQLMLPLNLLEAYALLDAPSPMLMRPDDLWAVLEQGSP